MSHASWQMRAAGLRVESESAYRSDSAHGPSPERHNVDGGTNNGDAPWFHVGSLSSGYGCAFMSGSPEAEAGLRLLIDRDQERIDWTKRASWWQRVYQLWDGGIPAHHAQTVAEFEALCAATHIDPVDVAWWRRSYDAMVSWDERP